MKVAHPTVTIELLFLDLQTCDRCCDTDHNLDMAVEQVRSELHAQGTTVQVRRRHVTTEAQAVALGFEISSTIRVNGRDIQLDWHASACGACTELADNANSVDCRVWHWQGILIVTLPEATPVHEAERLTVDLARAGIKAYAWVINQSLLASGTAHPILCERGSYELSFVRRVADTLSKQAALIPWLADAPIGEAGLERVIQ